MVCLALSSRRLSLSVSADSIMTCVSSADRGPWGTEHGQSISEKNVVQSEMRTGCTNRLTM